MKILAIDTATDACSAALYHHGEITQHYQVAPQQHHRLILTMVEELLQTANLSLNELDALAFGCGPGSFTGTRLAASVVQGLAYAARLPVIPVSDLLALAHSAATKPGQQILAALDARMNEVYWGTYCSTSEGEILPLSAEMLSPADQLQLPNNGPWLAIGNAFQSYPDLQVLLKTHAIKLIPESFPRAKAIAAQAVYQLEHGKVVAAELALPTYLRAAVVKTES